MGYGSHYADKARIWIAIAGSISSSLAQAQGAGPAEAAVAALPHDLSAWSMFMNADMVVKAVMVGLIFASLITWTIGVAKAMELLIALSRAQKALRVIAANHIEQRPHCLRHPFRGSSMSRAGVKAGFGRVPLSY